MKEPNETEGQSKAEQRENEINKELEGYYKEFSDYTARASEINRAILFGGLAVVWLFKIDTKDGIDIPLELIIATFFFAFSFSIDLMQYVFGAFSWLIVYLFRRKKADNGEDILQMSPIRWINYGTIILFTLKIIGMIVAYCFLFTFLLGKIGIQ